MAPTLRSPGAPSTTARRDDAVGDDGPLAVDVVQERVERPGPLDQAAAAGRPVLGGHDPRHEVDREQPVAGARRPTPNVTPRERCSSSRASLAVRAGPAAPSRSSDAEDPGVRRLPARRPGATSSPARAYSGSAPVAGQRRRPGQRRARRGRAAQEQVDDVGEAPAALVRRALLGRGAAPGERPLGQRRSRLLPVAGLLQLRAQVVEQPRARRRRRARAAASAAGRAGRPPARSGRPATARCAAAARAAARRRRRRGRRRARAGPGPGTARRAGRRRRRPGRRR